jgi:hypothetical protein
MLRPRPIGPIPSETARTDSTHILAAVRALNRFEVGGETMRHALNTLAAVAGEHAPGSAIHQLPL